MQITNKSAETVQQELESIAGLSVEVFKAASPRRPDTVEFRFSEDFRTQKEALEKMGYNFTACGGAIACEPVEDAPVARKPKPESATDRKYRKLRKSTVAHRDAQENPNGVSTKDALANLK